MLLGIIIGVFLTVVVAYAYDASTGRAPNGLSSTAADGQAPLVNWDVVNANWNVFKARVSETSTNLERTLKRHTG